MANSGQNDGAGAMASTDRNFGVSTYIHGLFRTRTQELITPPSIPEDQPSSPTRMDAPDMKTSGSGSAADRDWTFGLFRDRLKRRDTWAGFIPLHSTPENPTANEQVPSIPASASSNNESVPTVAPVTWSFFNRSAAASPSTTNEIKPISAAASPAPPASTSILAGPGTAGSYQKGTIMSALMTSNDVTSRRPTLRSDDVMPNEAAPDMKGTSRRRSLFTHEQLPVNRKDLNMIAPTSM